MKKIKLFGFMLLLTALVLTTGTAYSQQDSKKTPEERATKISEKMKEKLSLSDEQQKQVYDIMLNHVNEMNGLKNSTEDKTSKHEKIKSLRESTHSKINSILSSEQQVKLEKFRQERKAKHKEWKGKKHDKQN
jgi:Spy/CpxP family protein refolding chaperone